MADELHKKKLKKNLAVLAMIVAWVALIWLITMVKIANAQDTAESYKNQRTGHQIEATQTTNEFTAAGQAHQAQMTSKEMEMNAARNAHQATIEPLPQSWWAGWKEKLYGGQE